MPVFHKLFAVCRLFRFFRDKRRKKCYNIFEKPVTDRLPLSTAWVKDTEKGGCGRKDCLIHMEDFQIVKLYWARNESAISESDRKYGRMLRSLSYSCLASHQDAEECVNDTYLDAWNTIPPERPTYLGAFLSKITRRISIDRFRHDHRKKRGGLGNVTEELTDCIPDSQPSPFAEYENKRLRKAINRFLSVLPDERRVMFVKRYFYAEPISQIARELNLTESNVKVTLHRTRESLRQYLGKEDLL